MAWKRGYLYRSRREGKKVVTEYLGNGYQALLAEVITERARAEGEAKRREWEAIKDEQQRLDAMVNDFSQLANMHAEVALLVNGFHKSKRVWRKQRGK